MKKNLLLLFTWACLFISCNHSTISEIDRERFLDPHSEDRASLFYSLNDSLNPELVRRQIRDFADNGVGGIFLHAREGLLTQYFSDEWWNVIDAAVDECVRTGMEPWFYDEYKWPSGYAAGYVPRKSEEYRGRYLIRLPKGEQIPEDGIIVSEDETHTYICMTTEWGNPWLNGTCKIDYLNPEAVKTFINHTYLTYAERNQTKYGSAGKGIFFDEPDIIPSTSIQWRGKAMPYSPAFRETFRREKGYDIADYFKYLFEEQEGYRKVRLDYWQMITTQYEQSFVGQLGEFCRANNLQLTGHFFPEETLAGNKGGIGNLMRQLRHQDRPGMDHLELRIEGGLNVAKSVSSVANQYGKKRRMSELFGVSGQNMSFEDRKWIANWHVVLGVNFFVEHLALYSMKGVRKRDFPPAISYQQPWWQQNKLIEDYMGRICYLSTLGEYAASTLLLVPIESEYIADERESNKLFSDYYSAMENLLAIHCDFDLGDEQIIEEIGHVTNSTLAVGEMKYTTVVIPELLTLRESTLLKLLDFSRRGGNLIIIGNYPRYVDAEKSHLLEQLRQGALLIPNRPEDMKKIIPAGLSIQHLPEAQIYTQKRKLQNGDMYFITNLSRTKEAIVTLSFDKKPQYLTIWNPVNGEAYKAKTNQANTLSFPIEEAGLYIITTGHRVSQNLKEYPGSVNMGKSIAIKEPWAGQKLSPNAIILDFACYSTNQGITYSNPEPVIGIAERLNRKEYTGPLNLLYEVELEEDISDIHLVVESPCMYNQIKVNEKNISFSSTDDYYMDYQFKQSENIAAYLYPGKNTISFALDYKHPVIRDTLFVNRYGTEIESIYLIGDFAVKAGKSEWNYMQTEKNILGIFKEKPVHRINNFSLVPESVLFNDDLTTCGYPFYAGKFRLTNQFEISNTEPGRQYYIDLPLSEAIVYQLKINGHEVGTLYSSPFRWNITSYIHEGKNKIEFTICNSLRNLLGPHHHNGGELKGVSPISFSGSGGWPHKSGDSNWYDLRLNPLSSLKIWTDDYYIIPFGFIEPVVVIENE